MFSNQLTNLPKPYELFTQKKDEEKKEENSDEQQKGKKEGFQGTDDYAKQKDTFLGGIFTAVFFILFVLLGMIYYFNSAILLASELLTYYNKTEFWQKYKGKMVGYKIGIFFVLWMIVFCLNLLIMDTVFKNNDYPAIFYNTTIYYWTFVGTTMMIIGNIPSLVDVFENTIGYWCLKTPLFKLSNTMNMFKNRYIKSDKFTIPNDFLITTFDIPSFHDHFNDLVNQYPSNEEYNGTSRIDTSKSDFYIDLYSYGKNDNGETAEPEATRPDENMEIGDVNAMKARKELLKQVLTKNTIGHFIWVLLASYVSILLTANTIVK